MSEMNDSARPDAPPEETQASATTPETPPRKKSELADSELDKVAGGTLVGGAINQVMKNFGDALSKAARSG